MSKVNFKAIIKMFFEHSGVALRQLAEVARIPKMIVVYVIYNKEKKKIYIGQTKDLQKRLKLHNEKIFEKSYTARFYGRWELVYKEEYQNRRQALIREKQLKSYRGRIFLRQFIPAWRNGSADPC